jgi:hypothetical protein
MKQSRFAQYAAEESKRRFLGKLIKFVKGEWQMGLNRDPISSSQRFVAVMDTLTIGYMKWVGGEIVDHKMGLVADGFRAAHRNDLDDLGGENWEASEYGDRIDPWQKTKLLVLVSPTAPHDLFTFSTSTEGGGNAIGDLCAAHGASTEGAGLYPVVTLGTDSYQHSNRAFGRVKVPVFKIVDCVEAAPFNALVAEARGGAGFMPASASSPALDTPDMSHIAIASARQPPAPPMAPELTIMPTDEQSPPEEAPVHGEFDDEIPF